MLAVSHSHPIVFSRVWWFGTLFLYYICLSLCHVCAFQSEIRHRIAVTLSCHATIPSLPPRNRGIGHWCEFLYPFPLLRSLVRHLITWPKKKCPTEYGINSNPVPADSIKQFFYLFKKKEIEERMRSVSACNCFSIEYEILPSNDSFDLLTSR